MGFQKTWVVVAVLILLAVVLLGYRFFSSPLSSISSIGNNAEINVTGGVNSVSVSQDNGSQDTNSPGMLLDPSTLLAGLSLVVAVVIGGLQLRQSHRHQQENKKNP